MAEYPSPAPAAGGPSSDGYFALHFFGAGALVIAGLVFYGWRAWALIAVCVGAAALATAVWRGIGTRGQHLRYAYTCWMALLLALLLPAHWICDVTPFAGLPRHLWAAAVAGSVLLVALMWLLGGSAAGSIHPVIVVYLALVALFANAMTPHWVLQRNHVIWGDLLTAAHVGRYAQEGWMQGTPRPNLDAVDVEGAAEQLTDYTTVVRPREPGARSLDGLLRDQMPPLEDLILGAQPGPVGASSAAAIILGGLLLVYWGVNDARIPLVICVTAFVAFLVLPIPLVITEHGITWRWLPVHQPGVGWAAVVTFAAYELLTGPLLMAAFFLATAATVRPMSRGAQIIYAVLIGVVAAALQLYLCVQWGAYLAVLCVGIATPVLDRLFKPRPLVGP